MYNELLGFVLIILGLELFGISLYQFIEKRKTWEITVVFKFKIYSIFAVIFGIFFIGYGFFILV